MTAGYRALREGAAWLDLAGRGVIRVTGEDRARLLHAMTTNHVERLKPSEWCYAFFLNAQGRMLADVNVLCEDEALVLDTEPETRALMFEHLDKFIIADDVELEDASDATAVIGIEGPLSADILASAGLKAEWAISATGSAGFRLLVPVGEKAEVVAKLEAAGAVAATAEDVRVVRLEHAKPRYGEDLSDAHIPHEARLLGAVHFTKGCYLGQEIVERVRSRGKPNRLLTLLEIEGSEPVPVGAKVVVDGKELGEVTSAAYSPREGKVLALGYVRAEAAGKPLSIAERSAAMTNRLVETAAV